MNEPVSGSDSDVPRSGDSADYSLDDTAATHWRPHDLAWLHRTALNAGVAHSLPAWARTVLGSGAPLVVRRAPRNSLELPLGIRGASRRQRQAIYLPLADIVRRVTPEQLAARSNAAIEPHRRRAIPAFAAWPSVREILDASDWAWGVGGAVAYELATGCPAAHAASDIDLLVRTHCRPDRDALVQLASATRATGVRCDIQLETPLGGVAMTDWLSGAREVMVKTDAGPRLIADPWLRGRTGLDASFTTQTLR